MEGISTDQTLDISTGLGSVFFLPCASTRAASSLSVGRGAVGGLEETARVDDSASLAVI